MKYIDRKKIGIEMLFAFMSPITSQENEMSAEDTVKTLCEQPRKTRAKIAEMINSGIKTLTKNTSIDVKEYLNEDINDLAKYPVTEDTMKRLEPFFEWLMNIQRENALARDYSKYMLNDAASRMDRNTADFLRSYSDISGQGVTLMRRDDSVIMYTQERFWGRAGLVFPDVDMKFVGSFPIVGFVFWIDTEYHDNNRYTVTFMLDVEFGNTENQKRTLQDRNWVKFTFECSRPYMELNSRDYGKMFADAGKCGHDFIAEWSSELMLKEATIGESSLSDREKELMPAARVLRLAYQLAEIDEGQSPIRRNDARLSDKVLETLENRYKFDFFEKLFKSVGEEELYNLLNDAMVAWSNSDFDETCKNVWSFARRLKEKEAADTVRPLYKKIIEQMRSCTAEFDGESEIYGSCPQALENVRAALEPDLNSMGFSGEFPHYRRRRGNKGEYISVIMSDLNDFSSNGKMKYRFELAAAVKKLKKQSKGVYFAAGMPFDETAAEDCRSVSDKNAKYARLGGDYDGSVSITSVELFDGIAELNNNDEEPTFELNKFAQAASDAMKGKKIPRWYKKIRRESKIKPQHKLTLGKALLKYLPFGLYLTLMLLLSYFACDYMFTVTDYFPQLTADIAMYISLITGLLVTLICASVKIYSKKKRIWRY